MGGVIGTIVIGALAGWLSGLFVKKEKGGCLWNIIIGVIGGFIGGNVLGWFGVEWGGFWGQLGTGIIGAVILLWVWNLITGK